MIAAIQGDYSDISVTIHNLCNPNHLNFCVVILPFDF